MVEVYLFLTLLSQYCKVSLPYAFGTGCKSFVFSFFSLLTVFCIATICEQTDFRGPTGGPKRARTDGEMLRP